MAAPPQEPGNLIFDNEVRAVAISPNGRRIAVGLANGTIEIWDLLIRDKWATCTGHTDYVNSVAFSPDGQTVVSGGEDQTLRLWDINGNPIGQPFQGHTDDVNSVAFSPDGQTIASGSSDQTIRLWDINGNAIAPPFEGHSGSVFAVAFRPDGQTIASGSSDTTVRLWDLEGNAIRQPFEGHTNTVFSVAFSPDGYKLISCSGDNTVRIWDLVEEPAFFPPLEGHTDAIYSVAFSPNGQFVVSGGYDHTAWLWDIENSSSSLVFSDHTDSIRSVVFSPDGEFIISGSQDGTVRLWDFWGNPVIHQPFSAYTDTVHSIALSPDGNILVSGCDDWRVRLWDIDGHLIGEPFFDHESSVTSVDFSPSGQLIASAGGGIVQLRDLNGQDLGFFTSGYANAIAFSPDGNIIATGGYDNIVNLWDLQGQRISENSSTEESMIKSIAFSPDGQTIVSGSDDKTLRLWDLQGYPISQPFQGHQNAVNAVAFSPDGKTVVSGSDDKTLRLWDLQGYTIGQPFQGHEDVVNAVAFSPDGQTVVSGSNDGTVLLWDLSDPQHQRYITIAEDVGIVYSVAFDPNGDYIFSAGENGIKVWRWLKFDSQLNENSLNILRTAQPFRNDQPTGEDTLNVTKELHALADVLMLRSLQPPLAVAILGSWGSGKSFAMHLIKQQITKIRCQSLTPEQAWSDHNDPNDSRLSPFVGHIYQINFDAWSYSKSDLWASLMQTIFDQLNRQLTLEKQLAEILTSDSLLQGGNIWQVLNEMNESDRKAFLESELSTEVLKQWKAKSTDVNALWDILTQLRQEEQDKLKSTEEQLQKFRQQKEQLDLEVQQQKKQVEQEVNKENEKVALVKSVIIQLKLIEDKKENSIFKDLLHDLGIKIPDLGFLAGIEDDKIVELIKSKDKTIDSLVQNADKIKNILNFKPSQISAFIEFLQNNPKKLLFFIFCAGLPFLAYGLLSYLTILLASISKFWLQISTLLSGIKLAVTLLATFPAVQQGLKIIKKVNVLKTRINQLLQDFKQKYQQEHQKLEIEKDKKINQKIEELNDYQQNKEEISKINSEIEKLETQVKIQRQRVGLTAQSPSMLDFIAKRLEENSYQEKLGLMHQIKRDLEDLTEHLAYNSANPNPDKLAALKQHFPRGPARIVLYIDDLDRCPPDKVVQVLEAVQLLLKTELFIVILAIDDRYINRALENVYRGVLKRGGSPSGTDYIEKIIQIPYRMRPIADATDIEQYLKSLIDIEEEKLITSKKQALVNTRTNKVFSSNLEPKPEETDQKPEIIESEEPRDTEISIPESTESSASPDSNFMINQIYTDSPPIEFLEHPPENPENQELPQPSPTEPVRIVDKFTLAEFEIIKECCQHVDITPRTGKRLINICKILKIIWTPAPNDSRWKNEPDIDVKKSLVAFLALAGRYPTQMRKVLAEIYLKFEQSDKQRIELKKEEFLNELLKQDSFMDMHHQREWKKFKYDFQKMPPADEFIFERRTFNLAMSFCFVGDVGYDPDDMYNREYRFDDAKKLYGFNMGKSNFI
ncbi:MAG TPA: P-loop NTPase fold protein [Nostocaceae cyanobacterium]|nr:P-loop NTPase fold protein [Nostocaceae cyanobacterium]